MELNKIILSHATSVGASGATAAATYIFLTKGYGPPQQGRAIDNDVVINQNGRFKYIYDNGPAFKEWSPFGIILEDGLQNQQGGFGATAHLAHLIEMWEHKGVLGLRAPEATYTVAWARNALERNFRVFPKEVGDATEYEVIVQFEEAQ